MYVTTANNNQASSKFCAAKTSRTYTIPSLTHSPSVSHSLFRCYFSLSHSSFPLNSVPLSSRTPTLFRCTSSLHSPYLSSLIILSIPLCNHNVTVSYNHHHCLLQQVTTSLCVSIYSYYLFLDVSNVWTRLSFSASSVTVIISIIMNLRSPLILRWFFYLVTTFTQLLTIQRSFVSTSVSSSDLCYLSHGGASETFTINEAVPIGSIVGSLKVSS